MGYNKASSCFATLISLICWPEKNLEQTLPMVLLVSYAGAGNNHSLAQRHQTCTPCLKGPCLKGGIISNSLPEMGNWPSYLEGKSFPVLRQSLGSSYLVGENLPVLGSCSSNMWIYYPWALPDAGCHMASAAKFVNNSASPTIKEFPKINWTQAARAGARGTFWLFHVTS